MEKDEKYFSLRGLVVWDNSHYSTEGMISRYGEGPFEVVGLSIVNNKKCPAVTIQLEDGKRDTLTGEWFKKVE